MTGHPSSVGLVQEPADHARDRRLSPTQKGDRKVPPTSAAPRSGSNGLRDSKGQREKGGQCGGQAPARFGSGGCRLAFVEEMMVPTLGFEPRTY
jgi:hypothetical protein